MTEYTVKTIATHPVVIKDTAEGIVIRLEGTQGKKGWEQTLSWAEWDALVAWVDWRRHAMKVETKKAQQEAGSI